MIALLDEECLRPGEVRKLTSQVKFIVCKHLAFVKIISPAGLQV